ncbi:hypothetical protein R70006_03196 [Paraburkholderia domus]|nr:hypothetical protein R70006_03196 [Paraburkholderia domus]
MKTQQIRAAAATSPDSNFPDAVSLAILRVGYAGLFSRAAVARYLPGHEASGEYSRAMLGRIRRELIGFAETRHRAYLANVFQHALDERLRHSGVVETLRPPPVPQPQIRHDAGQWLTRRAAKTPHAHRIRTVVGLTVDRADFTSAPLVGGDRRAGRDNRAIDRSLLRRTSEVHRTRPGADCYRTAKRYRAMGTIAPTEPGRWLAQYATTCVMRQSQRLRFTRPADESGRCCENKA